MKVCGAAASEVSTAKIRVLMSVSREQFGFVVSGEALVHLLEELQAICLIGTFNE